MMSPPPEPKGDITLSSLRYWISDLVHLRVFARETVLLQLFSLCTFPVALFFFRSQRYKYAVFQKLFQKIVSTFHGHCLEGVTA